MSFISSTGANGVSHWSRNALPPGRYAALPVAVSSSAPSPACRRSHCASSYSGPVVCRWAEYPPARLPAIPRYRPECSTPALFASSLPE